NPELFAIDIGTYYPLSGHSNAEIAAQSRSMHRSQGFGTAAERGQHFSYLKLLKGAPAKKNIFEGIDMSWSRIEGGKAIEPLVQQVIDQYQLSKPAASIPALLNIYSNIKELPDGFWKEQKLNEIKDIIRRCAGLFLEAATDTHAANPGTQITLNIEATNRSKTAIQLQEIEVTTGKTLSVHQSLEPHKPFYKQFDINLPQTIPYSSPYWLRKPWNNGRYTVDKQQLRGLPETPQNVQTAFHLTIDGVPITYRLPVVYTKVDPARGEIIKILEIVPPVSVKLAEEVYVFSDNEPKPV